MFLAGLGLQYLPTAELSLAAISAEERSFLQ
jgi:hypothetical protein